jgi:hypothetical protein
MDSIGEEILRINEKPIHDDSIKLYENAEYNPIVGTQLNTAGVITITIDNYDQFLHPHESGLLIEGTLVKEAASAVYAAEDLITLVNSGPMFLFSGIKYSLSGQEIESVNNPGQATVVMNMLKRSPDFERGPGLSECFYSDSDTTAAKTNKGFVKRQNLIIKQSNPRGTFSFYIPLASIFGFCDDYGKIMYGFRHQLQMVRKSDDDAIFRAAGVDAGKCVLTKIAWIMPHVGPNDIRRVALYNQIADNDTYEAAFRQRQCDTFTVPQTTETSWRLGVRTAKERPCFLIIAFQTGKTDTQTTNPAVFDHCALKNLYVVLNTERYPAIDNLTDFTKLQYSLAYKAMSEFISRFYTTDKLVANNTIDPLSFKNLYPLFVFDVTKQSERLQHGIVDMTVKMQFHGNCPENTQAYALVCSNRLLNIRSSGQKMDVIY